MIFFPATVPYLKKTNFRPIFRKLCKKSRRTSSGRQCILEGLSLAAAYNSGGGGGGGGGWSMAHGGGREGGRRIRWGKEEKTEGQKCPPGKDGDGRSGNEILFPSPPPSPVLPLLFSHSVLSRSLPPASLSFCFSFPLPSSPDQNEIVPDSAALQQWGKREELPVVLSYSYKLWQVFGHPPILPTQKKNSP